MSSSTPLRLRDALPLIAFFAGSLLFAQVPEDKGVPGTQDVPATPAPGSSPSATSSPVKAHSDAEIIAMVMALDENEIKAANAVMKQDVDSNVKDLAHTIAEDHSTNLNETEKLAAKLGVTPRNTAAVKDLRNKGKQTAETLSSGSSEGAFVSEMVSGHRDALAMLDQFASTAKNKQLKAHLATTREHVAHHLEMAEQLESSESASAR